MGQGCMQLASLVRMGQGRDVSNWLGLVGVGQRCMQLASLVRMGGAGQEYMRCLDTGLFFQT